jgi:predicted PurR-regulated permease PerM
MPIFKKKNHQRLLSIFLSYFLVLLTIFIGFKLLIPTLLKTFTNLINEMPNYLNILNNKILSDIPNIKQSVDAMLNQILSVLTKLSEISILYILSIASVIVNILMGVILSIYMLYDKEKIYIYSNKLLNAIFCEKKAKSIICFFKNAHNIFYGYILGKVLDSLIVSVISFIGFKFLFKMDNVIFLSLIIFITNMIPYFGPFIGAIPPILMSLSVSKAIWVGIFILILQQIDGNFIGPKVMGEQVGLSPLWIISSVIIGGGLFGIVGVILSVPVAAIIKTSLDKFIERKI